jgi:hypothetical protein
MRRSPPARQQGNAVTDRTTRSRPSQARTDWLTRNWIRKFHTYCGGLFAPAILFFAISGALQVFHLQKARPSEGYQPPAMFQTLDQLHKDQSLRSPREKASIPDASAPRSQHARPAVSPSLLPDAGPRPISAGQLALKWYVTVMAAALVMTTLAGLYMALQNRRERVIVTLLVSAGIIIPLSLLAL